MAVYTAVTDAELEAITARLGLRPTGSLRAVAEGIENSTYFFCADAGATPSEYVLTILENTTQEQMWFSASLCLHLARHGLPVPAPLTDPGGDFSVAVKGKQALVFPRARGHHPHQIGRAQCEVMGRYMAEAHRAGQSFGHHLTNSRGLPWMEAGVKSVEAFLSPEESGLMAEQLGVYRELRRQGEALPVGPIHGDLFTDNALFEKAELCGVIDFYNACSDWLLLDIAIAVNDWCSAGGGPELDVELTEAFLGAYRQVRPFTAVERRHWQSLLCLAATRFWLSRLIGCHRPELLGDGEVKTKDPGAYRTRLLRRRAGVPPVP